MSSKAAATAALADQPDQPGGVRECRGLYVWTRSQPRTAQLRLGIDGQYSAVNSVANRYNVNTGALSAQSTRYPDGDNSMNSIAAYVTHTWEVTPKFSVHDGLRFTSLRLESSFGDTSFFPFPVSGVMQENTVLAGNLGVVWRPDLHVKVSLLGTTGFRAPNVG